MKDKLQAIREEALKQIRESNRLDKLNEVRVSFLGKKGELTAVLKGMKNVDPKERPFVGQMVNETREALSLIHISEPTRHHDISRMPSSA